jgi:hypothetical protein
LGVEAHHVKSKGAGGHDRAAIGLCTDHHREGHNRGWVTFQAKYGVDLVAVAAALSQRYDEETA